MPELLYAYEVEGADEVAAELRALAIECGGPDALRFADDATRALAEAGVVMKTILDEAAVEAKDTAAYIPRTGYLDDSTFAGPIEVTGRGVRVEFGARADYASHVERRGFSRTAAVAAEAEKTIDAALHALGTSLL